MTSKDVVNLRHQHEKKSDLTELGLKAWKDFEWDLPGDFTNKETLRYCFNEIFREFPDFFSGSNPETLMSDIELKRRKLIVAYREVFPKEKEHEPFYHNISEDEEWNDHVGLVMASSSRLFLGMLKMQKMLASSEDDENLDLKAEFAKKFGEKWLETKFTLTELKKSLAMALVHEAGEWWTRGIWEEVLEMQRLEIERWKNGELKASEIRTVDTLSIEYKRHNIIGYARKLWKTKKLMKAIQKIVGEDGIQSISTPQKVTEFDVFFSGGTAKDVDFSAGEDEIIEDPILRVLTAIFKGADFTQSLASYYLKIKKLGGSEVKIFGSIALFYEFLNYRPNALVQQGWKEIEDVSVGDFYYDNFFSKYFDQTMFQLFLLSAAEIDQQKYEELKEVVTQDVEAIDIDNHNVKKLLVQYRILTRLLIKHRLSTSLFSYGYAYKNNNNGHSLSPVN
jgi:hypothetical protein